MNQVRIIGGTWKRRLIKFAEIEGLRPTPDRIRETLFNWLMWDINATTHVLDVCAGSGVLGLEALSRGAQHAILIEPNVQQAQAIKTNLHILQCTQATVIQKTAQQTLALLAKSAQPPFDLVFLDPPYALNLWQELAELIDPLLSQHAKIYVEADRPLHELGLPVHWQLLKETKAGTVRAGLYGLTH